MVIKLTAAFNVYFVNVKLISLKLCMQKSHIVSESLVVVHVTLLYIF